MNFRTREIWEYSSKCYHGVVCVCLSLYDRQDMRKQLNRSRCHLEWTSGDA